MVESVLILEEDLGVSNGMSEFLKKRGYEPQVVSDIGDAQRRLMQVPLPSCLIVEPNLRCRVDDKEDTRFGMFIDSAHYEDVPVVFFSTLPKDYWDSQGMRKEYDFFVEKSHRSPADLISILADFSVRRLNTYLINPNEDVATRVQKNARGHNLKFLSASRVTPDECYSVALMELVRLYNRGNVNIGLGIDELVSNFGPVSLANLRQSIADAYKNSFEYGGRLADDRLERDNALPIKIIFEGNASDINSFRESLRNNSSRDVYTTSVILLRATLRN